jgi:hypothetical protein
MSRVKEYNGDYTGLDKGRAGFYSWLRQGSAALILGAAIVCGGLICNPLHARASTSPAPAKPVAVLFLHEILIEKGTVEPQIIALTYFRVVALSQRHLECQTLDDCPGGLGINRRIHQEFVGELITRFVRQNFSNSPAIENLSRCSRGFSERVQIDGADAAMERVDSIAVVSIPPSEFIGPYSDAGQLKRDSGTGAAISGFGGDFGCGPHLLAGLPEGPREPSDSDSSKRRDDAFQRVNNFSDLKQDEWRKVIGGAVFVAGLSFLAYLARRA